MTNLKKRKREAVGCYLRGVVLMAAVFVNGVACAQRVDTLYYNRAGDRLVNSEEATAVRYVTYPSDGLSAPPFRTYDRYGSLLTEGTLISLDTVNDSNSVFRNFRQYNENGVLRFEYSKERGREQEKEYYGNGRIRIYRMQEIQGNDTVGELTSYYENGNMKEFFHTKNSKPEGEAKQYYENGNLAMQCTYAGGVVDGEAKRFYDNGNLYEQTYFVQGKEEGVHSELNAEGTYCVQTIMKDGELALPYYQYTSINGNVMKYNIADNRPYIEQPTIGDLQTIIDKGTTWQYYNMNGITLLFSLATSSEYGNYYCATISLTNNGGQQVELDAEKIRVHVTDQKQKQWYLHVWTAAEYMYKVRKNQAIKFEQASIARNQAVMSAGKSVYHASTTTNRSGSASAVAIGSDGIAVSSGYYSGQSTEDKTTVVYDERLAMQERMMAEQRLQNYKEALNEDFNSRDEGYLKRMTVLPGETLTGYVLFDYDKSINDLTIMIPVGNIFYTFQYGSN